MDQKVAQVQKTNPAYTRAQLEKALNDAGMSGKEGAYKHFQLYGMKEDVSPNKLFNVYEYYESKASEFYKVSPGAVTAAQTEAMKKLILDANSNAWDHYTRFGGTTEGRNPSNSFDSNAYLTAKLAALVVAEPDSNWTMQKLQDILFKAGVSALQHFTKYGGNGPGEVATSYAKDPNAFPVAPGGAVPPEPTPGPTPNPGKTFALTINTDVFTGGAGDDIFIAGLENSLNPGDQLDGGAGANVLKVYDTIGESKFNSATVKNIQNVENYAGTNFDVSGNADVKEVWSMAGSTDTTTANLTQKIGYSGVGVAEIAKFAGTDTGADAATIALKDAGKTAAFTSLTVDNTGGAGFTKIEKLTLEATGKNQIGNLIAGAMTDLVITGSGSVTATLNNSGATIVKNVDASAATGDISLTDAGIDFNATTVIKSGSGKDSFTITTALKSIDMGAGDDRLTMEFADLTKAMVVDGGAGTDTLIFSDTSDFTTGTNYDKLTLVKNIEALGVGGVTLTADVSKLGGITNFLGTAVGSKFVLTNATSTTVLALDAVANTGVNTVAMSTTSNALGVTLNGSSTAASTMLGSVTAGDGLTVTGTAVTLTVTSNGSFSSANSLDATLESRSIVKIIGDQNLTLALTKTASADAYTVDAKNFGGKLTYAGTAVEDNISVGAKGGKITANAGIDNIDLSLSAAASDLVSFNTVIAAANRDIVKGFVATGDYADKVQLSGTTETALDASKFSELNASGKIYTLTTGTTSAATATVVELSFDAGNLANLGSKTDGSELNKLANFKTTSTDGTETTYIVAYDDGNAYLYYGTHTVSSTTSVSLGDGDISLIGVFNNVAVGDFSVNNFLIS